MTRAVVFPSFPKTLNPSGLECTFEPTHLALAKFISSCAAKQEDRTTAITALVLTMWQLATRGVTQRPLSLPLVNATPGTADPISQMIGQLLDDDDIPASRLGSGIIPCLSPERAPREMVKAVVNKRKWDSSNVDYSELSESEEQKFHEARKMGFGGGDISTYSKAWHPQLGLSTDSRNSIILFAAKPEDQQPFLKDLLTNPRKTKYTSGIGLGLQKAGKIVSMNGTFNAEELIAEHVDAMIKLGSPFFLIPHLTNTPIEIPNLGVMRMILNQFRKQPFGAMSFPSLISTPWFDAYHNYLYTATAMLPVAYRFCVMECVHQLQHMCSFIGNFVACFGKAGQGEAPKLQYAIHRHTLRGIALSIAGLAWYVIGFDPHCPVNHARKLLSKLRTKGSMSLRDVQRLVGFENSKERDKVLAILAEKKLLVVVGKKVTAISHEEFVKSLHGDARLPAVPVRKPL